MSQEHHHIWHRNYSLVILDKLALLLGKRERGRGREREREREREGERGRERESESMCVRGECVSSDMCTPGTTVSVTCGPLGASSGTWQTTRTNSSL